MMLPIEVFYDDETREVEVTGEDEIMAQVFLYDGNGNVLDYSSCINTVLYVPDGYVGMVTVRIEEESWSATGQLVVR